MVPLRSIRSPLPVLFSSDYRGRRRRQRSPTIRARYNCPTTRSTFQLRVLPLRTMIPKCLPTSRVPCIPTERVTIQRVLPSVSNGRLGPAISTLAVLYSRRTPSLGWPRIRRSSQGHGCRVPPHLQLPTPKFFTNRTERKVLLQPLPTFPSPSPRLRVRVQPP